MLTVKQAHEDFRVAMMRVVRGRSDPEEVRRGISELLTILYGMDERFRAEHLPSYRPAYARAPESDAEAQTAKALRLMRGALQHRGVLAFAREDLAPSETLTPSEVLTPGKNWTWLPVAEVAVHLQDPTQKPDAKLEARQVSLYDRHLAGRTVLQTIDMVGDYFWRLAAQRELL